MVKIADSMPMRSDNHLTQIEVGWSIFFQVNAKVEEGGCLRGSPQDPVDLLSFIFHEVVLITSVFIADA